MKETTPTLFYLIKFGEIALKKGNRKDFERQLANNIRSLLKGSSPIVTMVYGRCYLSVEAQYKERVEKALQATFGIVSFAKTQRCEKDLDVITEAVRQEYMNHPNKDTIQSFRVSARRIDKSFPHDSMQLQKMLGSTIYQCNESLRVDLQHPDLEVNVEIREKAYIYSHETQGQGGLPLGTAGQGLLLLSGGIDSPVAGLMMASRGMKIRAIHFHTMPFTSMESLHKVRELARLMSHYTAKMELIEIPFTDLQQQINSFVSKDSVTLQSRAMMVKIATTIATAENDDALITGESLSQVASQTVGNLNFTDSFSKQLVLRPLIGLDKETIIKKAKSWNTFTKSIEPHVDCCTLFSPKHPVLRPKIEREQMQHDKIESSQTMIDDAIAKAKRWYITPQTDITLLDESTP